MSFVTTKDGIQIFFKDWGPKEAQPIVFHHGWPLSADDWDAQMLFFLSKGFRVVAHDRRGHGRSEQVSDGHDMDHYAADASAVAEHLDLKNAIHVGHSTGGGQVARYVARHGQPQGRVAKAVLVSAVPPLMVKTADNPGGTPVEVFDGFRAALAANRAQFYLDVPSGPFYGYNRPGAQPSQGTIQNWWRQGMMGSAKAHYEGIKAFSETDQTEDLKAITVPTLVMQGDDDQVVPYKNAVHIGHSTGGGEVAAYVARYGIPQGRVAKAVLVSAVPPIMLKTERYPGGLPIEVFDGLRAGLAAGRSQFFRDVAAGPFYGFNREGADVKPAVIDNWWRQGMMGSAKAHYEGIKAFSETDQTDDLKAITVPTLVLHGDDDQVVPYKNAGVLQAEILPNATLRIYEGFSHGMLTVNADTINPDLLAFVQG